MGRRLLQSERNATLLIDVLRSQVAAHRFALLDFVIMPDHVHLLVKLDGSATIEKAMQWIKGGFSYRLKKEMGYLGEVWQRGYSELRVIDEEQLRGYRKYIAENPVRAGLAPAENAFPYCLSFLASKKAQSQG